MVGHLDVHVLRQLAHDPDAMADRCT
ncbi:hypothetical protein [Actinacidiphila acidipaludis]